jgi:L-ribulose-5-phosphate 4-epimerase
MSLSLKDLREQVLEANLELVRNGLVISTFGNASGILRDENLVAIKPSGVSYDHLCPEDLVVTNLQGDIVEGSLRPSSDLPTHLELYDSFPAIGGIAHTHSRFATAWAQAGREIPCLGTTHADYFFGAVPVTRSMECAEIESDYEANTGKVIAQRFEELDPAHFPGVLVASHGPFAWGADAREAAHNAALLEEIARIAWYTLTLNLETGPVSQSLLDKHFLRKHGPKAYYGQK